VTAAILDIGVHVRQLRTKVGKLSIGFDRAKADVIRSASEFGKFGHIGNADKCDPLVVARRQSIFEAIGTKRGVLLWLGEYSKRCPQDEATQQRSLLVA
jgi:hypothetical protein